MAKFWTSTAKVIALLLFLIITNPESTDIFRHIQYTSKNFWWSSTRLLSSSLQGWFTGEHSEINFFLFSLVKASKRDYFIGIAGYWIDPYFWGTIPGWWLVASIIFSAITDFQLLRIYWFESIFSILGYGFFLQSFEAKIRDENIVPTFYFLVSASSLLIVVFVFYPTKLFRRSENPCSWLYALTSASAVYMANFADEFIWMGVPVNYSQVVLALLVTQLLFGHTYGFAGSLGGMVFCWLRVNSMIF